MCPEITAVSRAPMTDLLLEGGVNHLSRRRLSLTGLNSFASRFIMELNKLGK